jgi:pimeloyl-ACP methyl ester carboxylesterase
MQPCQLSLLLIIITLSSYGQDKSTSEIDIRQKYDSAKILFKNYEQKHGGFVTTKNTRLHYLQWGDPKDTPFIWVHGSFTNAHEIAGVGEALSKKGYWIIAPDVYGHGLTTIPKNEVSLYHFADDINELIQAKGIKKAVIGGWSRGGIIATAFYDAYPEKVLALVLEDGGSVSTNTHYHKMSDDQLKSRVTGIFKDKVSYPKYNTEFDAYKSYYDFNERGTQFTLLAWIAKDEDGLWTIGPGIEELFNMKTADQFFDTVLRPTKTSLFATSMAMIEPRIIYRNLSVPMFILDPISDDDLFPYEKENENLAQLHPNLITHKKYTDTGHNIHYQRPEMFIDDVLTFLNATKTFWKER